jgi:integrase
MALIGFTKGLKKTRGKPMKETFERVTEKHGKAEVPVKHLYRRQYQTAGGDWRTIFYAIFTDWKGKRRKFPLGSEIKAAKEALAIYEARNVKREDFDAEKEQARAEARRLTLEQWGELYFAEMINPGLRSAAWQRIMFNRLKASSLGGMFLDEIDEAAIDDYRDRRLRDPVTKFNGKDGEHKPTGRRIAYSTVNRELAILRILLRLAKRKKRIKSVPEFDLQSEKPLKRSRVASDDEISRVLANLARHWQRPVIGLLETAMRVSELLKLTWDKVDEKAGVIRLKAEDVKEKAPRVVPISPALQGILTELKAEQRKAKVTDLSPRVFIHDGQGIDTIRRPFELAREKAGVKDLHLHDLRHTAITRWAMAGVPIDAIMAAAGHHTLEMHNGYVNLNENHLREAFKLFPTFTQENASQKSSSVNT